MEIEIAMQDTGDVEVDDKGATVEVEAEMDNVDGGNANV